MEGATQTELATVLEIEKPTLGRLLDRLEEKGWIERHADKHDGRTKRIKLAYKAQPLLEKMYDLGDEILESAIAGLSKKEAEQLRYSLSKVKQNLSNLMDNNNQDSATK